MESVIEKAVNGDLAWSNVILIVLIVWLTQFITWAAKRLWIFILRKNQPNLHDLKVFQKYQNVFTQKVTDFINTHTFANPYLTDILDPVDEAFYYDRFNNPEFIFHDEKLEKQRKDTVKALSSFWDKLNKETFCLDSNTKYSNVPIRDNDPNQEYRDDVISEINILANELSEELKKFNKACLKKFDQKISTDNSPPQD